MNFKTTHKDAVASLRKRIKKERAAKGVKVGSVGSFYDVTELQFRDGSAPYVRDWNGSIRRLAVKR